LSSPLFGSTTTSTTRPTELHVDAEMGDRVPAFCNFAYPSDKWPPPREPQVAAHLITLADVPATMKAEPPLYPTNGPFFDEIAAGYPNLPIAEADYAVQQSRTFASYEDEILGRAASPRDAKAQYVFARDKVYGQCIAGGDGSPNVPFDLPQSGPTLVAYVQDGGSSYDSLAGVVVLGTVGDYVFDLRVGNHTFYPSTTPATPPTQAQVSAVVGAVMAHLQKHH
jgi:hypothetical protein